MYFKRLILAATLALSAGIADAQFMTVTPAGGSITPGKLTGCAASTLLYSDAASLLQCSATIPFSTTFTNGVITTNANTGFFARSNFGTIGLGLNDDVLLRWDAAGTLAQRNGANAQTFNIYNTYTDASNYEQGALTWSSNALVLQTAKAGTGTDRPIQVQSRGSITFGTGGAGNRWQIDSNGHFITAADNIYDIGASGATRPRNEFIAGFVSAENGYGKAGAGGATQGLAFSGTNTLIRAAGSGATIAIGDGATNTFTLAPSTIIFSMGGTTSSFPALKRSTTTLQARLADDSAFAQMSVLDILINNAAALVTSSVAMNNGAAAALGTLTNAPAAGNPTKWIPINDNGTTRYVPSW